ncbi:MULTISPECIES: PaaX family transcriptional regulator C-terminal domain-containing protein [Thermus]|jgi:phenylacetic acid degradation operon negative regulatory protein|uniref:Phenylacetic acid catabolic pathway repressor n=1 Tax=Thermus brockianus TaxID=56956 RepID=A0A1J0LSZ3_THEBO|nr:PaaX family transcriptional regulator C-terminal domain-containing protein [Thermus brockianus]APD09210.1 phenylacetic acid catabolic pathway repressor [Thermus brockianus]
MRARSTIFTLFLEYIYPERRARVKDLVAMMEALGFSEAAVRAALSRSAKRGWVRPERVGRTAYYALSDRVYWQVRQVRRRLYGPRPPWDGRFLLVLPEGPKDRGERERFRREMALLGYGSLQSGVYLGAGVDLEATRELLTFYRLPATLFAGEHLGPREEIQAIFPLERAQAHYRALFPLETPEEPEEAFRTLTRLVHEMRKVLFLDPLLPPELLPPGFVGPEARRQFLEARKALYGKALPFLEGLELPLTALSPQGG